MQAGKVDLDVVWPRALPQLGVSVSRKAVGKPVFLSLFYGVPLENKVFAGPFGIFPVRFGICPVRFGIPQSFWYFVSLFGIEER